MSIEKRVKNSLLLLSAAITSILLLVSLGGLFDIRSRLSAQMDAASETISSANAQDTLSLSLSLAESMARQSAYHINGRFTCIKGELLTLKGDIETLYRGGGLRTSPASIQRHEEYIVSRAAQLSPGEIEETVRLLGGVTAMFDNVLRNEEAISLAYVVLENGMVFSSTDTFYEEVEQADMRTRDWYKDAVYAGTIHWAELYRGTDGRSYVTAAVPVTAEDGTVFGVAAFDLRVGEISDVILEQTYGAVNDSFILSSGGTVLLSTQDVAKTAESAAYQTFMKNVDFSAESYGCHEEHDLILGYANIEETDWTLVNILDYNQVLDPVLRVKRTVATASDSVQSTMLRHILVIIGVFVLFFALLFCVTIFVSKKLAGRITQPLMELNRGVRIVAGGDLNRTIDIHTGDEIETLANSFNKMTHELLEQMTSLKRVTAEKERIGAELNVAKHIQASMLPCIFPAFPERSELDIYASMTPAREVGGDFYDFFLVDDDRLAIVMADVSGKGVPAALFMVIAKTLLKNVAQTGLSPKEVLEKVNNQLCVGNDAEMFVTVWLGILEISTGRLTCANAGHEYPVLKRPDGGYELVKDRHGFVLAGMEGSRYREYELQLEPGGRLFLYTDGVTEAADADNRLYGTDRLLSALNRSCDTNCAHLLTLVKEDIDRFVGAAPQFDDITMLSLELTPQKGRHMKKINLTPSLTALEQAVAFVEQEMEQAGVPIKVISQVNIAVDEIFSNIARYSGATRVTLGVSVEARRVTLRFADNGLPYNPTETPDPNIALSVEERGIGGLGIYMVKKSMDELSYEYKENLNILTVICGK